MQRIAACAQLPAVAHYVQAYRLGRVKLPVNRIRFLINTNEQEITRENFEYYNNCFFSARREHCSEMFILFHLPTTATIRPTVCY